MVTKEHGDLSLKVENRFDLIRFVFAGLVMVYHAIALSGLASDSALERGFAQVAELSIQGFFVLSGALVAGSFERSEGVVDYGVKRLRRLYPAYVVVILVPAIAVLLLSGGLADVMRYVGANLIFLNFLEPDLPGLFAGNRFTAVNGALWTLKIEVLFYALLPVLMMIMRRWGRWWPILLVCVYAAGELWQIAASVLIEGELGVIAARQLPGQMAYFACGVALWKLWDRLPAYSEALLVFGGLGTVLTLLVPVIDPLRALFWSCAIAGLAFAPGWKPAVSKYGDVSYGLYITHFPIIQVLVAFGVFSAIGLWMGVLVSVGVVLVASFALWHMVEKRALRPTSYYRRPSPRGHDKKC